MSASQHSTAIAPLPAAAETFDGLIGSGTSAPPLNFALWCATQAFSEAKLRQNVDFQRVWLFTNNDCPCEGDTKMQEHIIRRARDAYEMGQELQLWAFDPPSPRAAFRRDAFYERCFQPPSAAISRQD